MDKEGVLVRSIYYGRIGSQATERLLAKFGHEGSFLLRDSETLEGAYCLCVRKVPFVHTYRLVHAADGWCLQDSEVSLQKFSTLDMLIQHYRVDTGGNIVPLTDPLDKTRIQCSRPDLVYMEACSCSSSSGACSYGC